MLKIYPVKLFRAKNKLLQNFIKPNVFRLIGISKHCNFTAIEGKICPNAQFTEKKTNEAPYNRNFNLNRKLKFNNYIIANTQNKLNFTKAKISNFSESIKSNSNNANSGSLNPLQAKKQTKNLSNKNIFFMKKLPNFRNNTAEYRVNNTECIFQTMWSNFAYVVVINNNQTYENNLTLISNENSSSSELDFTRVDDESYSIFQNEAQFLDFETTAADRLDNYYYTIENKNSETLQKFYLELLNNMNSQNIKNDILKNNNKQIEMQRYSLITRIPQEFNINLKTDESVKILNMGDSKLLSDKEVNIHFTRKTKDNEEILSSADKNVSLEAKRLRSNNITIKSDKGFKLKLTARSYLEGENLTINCKDDSYIRIKKLGVAKKGDISLTNSDIEIRSVFSACSSHNNAEEYSIAASSPLNKEKQEMNTTQNQENESTSLIKHLEFKSENSNINIGSLQGNNFFDIKSSALKIENLNADNFILNAENLINLEIFIDSLSKLEESDFVYMRFAELYNIHHPENIESEVNIAKNKKIYLNEDNLNDFLILNINEKSLIKLGETMRRSGNIENASLEYEYRNSQLFRPLYGESFLLSLLNQHNKNIFDFSQINNFYHKFLNETPAKKQEDLLHTLKLNNSLFSKLKNLSYNSYLEEQILLINYFINSVLLKDVQHCIRLVFVNSEHIESFEVKAISSWEYTKKKIQNKINLKKA